jgi:hypothetical protein
VYRHKIDIRRHKSAKGNYQRERDMSWADSGTRPKSPLHYHNWLRTPPMQLESFSFAQHYPPAVYSQRW